MATTVGSVDDLQHEWPVDVLHYETRYFLGLSINELLIIGLPAIALMFLGGPLVGAAVGAAGLLLIKRFEALGGRSPLLYLMARLLHRLRREPVVLPLILPAGESALTLTLTTWEGEEVMRMGDD